MKINASLSARLMRLMDARQRGHELVWVPGAGF